MKKAVEKKGETDQVYEDRFEQHIDELRWLYMELYDNGSMFAKLRDNLERFYKERNRELRHLDAEHEKDKDWYRHFSDSYNMLKRYQLLF